MLRVPEKELPSFMSIPLIPGHLDDLTDSAAALPRSPPWAGTPTPANGDA